MLLLHKYNYLKYFIVFVKKIMSFFFFVFRRIRFYLLDEYVHTFLLQFCSIYCLFLRFCFIVINGKDFIRIPFSNEISFFLNNVKNGFLFHSDYVWAIDYKINFCQLNFFYKKLMYLFNRTNFFLRLFFLHPKNVFFNLYYSNFNKHLFVLYQLGEQAFPWLAKPLSGYNYVINPPFLDIIYFSNLLYFFYKLSYSSFIIRYLYLYYLVFSFEYLMYILTSDYRLLYILNLFLSKFKFMSVSKQQVLLFLSLFKQYILYKKGAEAYGELSILSFIQRLFKAHFI